MLNTPRIQQEPPYRALLTKLLVDIDEVHASYTSVIIGRHGVEYVASLGAVWQPLLGCEGVSIYHVPHYSGEPGLFLAVFHVEPGSRYDGETIDHSRLVGIIEGSITCNDTVYSAADFVWLPPGQPTNWDSQTGCLGVVRYNVSDPTQTAGQ